MFDVHERWQFFVYASNVLNGQRFGSRIGKTVIELLYEEREGLELLSVVPDGDEEHYMTSHKRGGDPYPHLPLSLRRAWRPLHAYARRAAAQRPDEPSPLASNLESLSAELGLCRLDREIFAFLVRYRAFKAAELLADHLINTVGNEPIRTLALLLGASPEAIGARLVPSAPLIDHGLVAREPTVRTAMMSDFAGHYRVAGAIARAVMPPACSLQDVRRALFGPPLTCALEWEDFAHLGEQGALAVSVLRGAIAARERGVNILLFGEPGTGKSEFARALAQRLGVPLFDGEAEEVADDHRGGPVDEVAAVRLRQVMLSRVAPALILYDEIDDLLGPASGGFGLFGGGPRRQGRAKKPIHRLIEDAPVPTIWTTNCVEEIDPAVLRRMTLAIEVRTPGQPVRERVWRRQVAQQGLQIGEVDIRALSRDFVEAPALAAGALRAARLAGGGIDETRVALSGIAKAMRGAPLADTARQVETYDLGLVRADEDVGALFARLARPDATRAFSLCLSGPPGAGKSELVRHLAQRLGMRVLQKRASDLLSPFVGATEQRIAAAFQEARSEDAFLIFDEADSLLRDRGQATHSWEVSQVNEMLTWMERHDRPFACTTNMPDSFDPATQRRFTFKLTLGYLDARQVRIAFRSHFGIDAPREVDALDRLTPGDFAVVRRKADVLGAGGDAQSLCAMLAREIIAKGEIGRAIGFDLGSGMSGG